ncbi:MAG: ATP synthase F1 subunit delta [Planctomycetota bacterium]
MPSSASAHDSVGRLYAQALMELSLEQQQLDTVAQELKDLCELVESDADLRRLITNPILGGSQRSEMLQRLFEGRISDLLYRFLQTINRKNRLAALPAIGSAFVTLLAAHRNEIEVEAHVASPMDAGTADRVAAGLGSTLGKQVTLTQHVDPSLIGGLKLRIGDRLLDASVQSQLRSIEQQLIAVGREKARASAS